MGPRRPPLRHHGRKATLRPRPGSQEEEPDEPPHREVRVAVGAVRGRGGRVGRREGQGARGRAGGRRGAPGPGEEPLGFGQGAREGVG